jgi:hypothetical protein
LKSRSILRDELHKEFENLLYRIQPNEKLITRFQEILQTKIDESYKDRDIIVDSLKKELKNIENKIERYTERI